MRLALLATFLIACEGIDTDAPDASPDASGDVVGDSQPSDMQADGALAPAPPPIRVLCAGDSITDGNAYPGGYRTELWRLLGGHVDFLGRRKSGPPELGDRDHEGYPGYDTKSIRSLVVNWLEKQTARPAVIVLHAGTNDLFAADALGRLEREWPVLVRDLHRLAPGARILAFPLSQWWTTEHARADVWNARLAVLAPQLGVELLDVRLTREETPDSTHPSPAAYRRMAMAIHAALAP